MVTVAATNVGDVVTSLKDSGSGELNPIYGGRFTGRDVGIKAGFVGGNMLVQYLLLKKHPKLAKGFAFFNFGQSIAPVCGIVQNTRVN